MKKYFKVVKIGNSIFALLPSKLIKQLDIKSGDHAFYELIPGKRQVLINFTTEASAQKSTVSGANDHQTWLDKLAGGLSP